MDREKVIAGLTMLADRKNDDTCEGLKCCKIAKDALALLKEQEDVQWINVKDKLPEKDGQYLVVYTFFDYRSIGIMGFSHNLHEIDEYIFNTENRPGWYEFDNEVGYFEKTTVTHWAKLPDFPKEAGEANDR